MADNELRFILRMRDEATAILKAHGMAVNDVGGAHQNAARSAKTHADALTELGRKAKEATEAVAALWGANELAQKSLEAFNEYEQGMIRIARTTQMAGQAMQDFQAQFDNMARQTKGASVESLLEFSTIAGQLGIKGSQDVLKFSETLGKLGTVTNITGEAGAKQFGRLLLLTGEGAGGVKKLADSLAGLQADTKASGAEILRMSSQLAQTTAGFKLGTAEITGMAAAATQLNIEPFLLSNAVGRSLRALKDGTLNATTGIRDLTTMLGTNRAEFLKLIDTHPEQAMLKFLNVIRALQANGQSVTGFLQKFQLQGDESQKVLLTLAKNVDEVNSKIKESQNLQNGSGKGGLDDQYKGFAESLQAEIDGLKTAWDLFAKDLGEAISPVVKHILQDFTDLFNGVDDLFRSFPDLGKEIAVWGAIGVPALFGLNQLLRVFGTSLVGVGGKVLGLAGNFTTLSAEARAAAAGIAAVEGELAMGKGVGAAAGGGVMNKLGKGLGFLGLALGAHEVGKQIASELNEAFPEATNAIGEWRHRVWQKITGQKDDPAKEAAKALAPDPSIFDKMKGRGLSAAGERPDDLGKVTPVFELSDENRQALEHFDQYTKRVEDLKKAQGALEALREGSKKGVAGQGDAKTDAEIDAIQKAIDLEMRALDPMNKLRDAWEENLASARAYTKEQQNQYEIAKAIAQLQRTNPRFTARDADEIRTNMSAIQDAQRTKAFKEQAIALNQQLAVAAALTQADKDRLEIDQQIAALAKDKGFTGDQLAQLRELMTLVKQTSEATAQFKALNPQADALVNYNAQLALLNTRLKQGTISQAEFNREKTKLDNDTLAARDPIGAIVQSQQEELQQLQVTGKYREADLKTLQQITELKKQGVLSDDASGRAIQAQLGSNNRMIQDIKDMQGELNSLTESFGSGLSTAIGQALNGQKYAFQKFLAGMGQKMMDMAFTNIAKSMEPSMNGLLGGMFGQAKGGIGALGDLAKKQADQTMATGQMTVTAATVIIQGAQERIGDLTKQAEAAGGQNPLTSGVSGAGNIKTPNSAAPLGRGGVGSDAVAAAKAAGAGGTGAGGASPFGGLGSALTAFGPKGLGASPSANAPVNPTEILKQAMTSSGSAGLSAGGRPTADALTQHLMQTYGLTREQATGAVGVMGYESGNFQTLQERGHSGYGSGYGYAQWTGPRRRQYFDYAQQRGLDPRSYEANQGFLDHELQGAYRGTIPALKATNDPQAAARAFEHHFEGMREGGPGVPAFQQHADRAQQYYNQGVGLNAPVPPNDALKAASGLNTNGVSDLAKKAQEQMQASQKALADSLKQTSQQTAGSLNGLQTGIAGVGEKAMTAAPDMSSFGTSISSLISKLGQGGGGGGGGLFGGLFGGMGGGGADVMAMHTGGLVGSTNTGLFRSVSPSMFAGASRFHNGLGDDEFPAILQKGERVLTRDQDTRASALMARMSDRLASTHAGESQAPARQNSHRVVMNIQTKDASSFRYSQPQIMAQAHAGISRAAAKNH